MDTIISSCEECGGRFRLKQELAGKKIRCPKCNAIMLVAASAQASEPRSASPGSRPASRQTAPSRRGSDEAISKRKPVDDRLADKPEPKGAGPKRRGRYEDEEEFERADDRPRRAGRTRDRADDRDDDGPRRRGRGRDDGPDRSDRPRRGRRRKKKNSVAPVIILAVVGGIVLLCGGIGVAFMFMGDEGNPPKQVRRNTNPPIRNPINNNPNNNNPNNNNPINNNPINNNPNNNNPNNNNPNNNNPNNNNPNNNNQKSQPISTTVTTFEGTVATAVHSVQVKKGQFYHVEVEGSDRRPDVSSAPDFIDYHSSDPNRRNYNSGHILPQKDTTEYIMVRPSFRSLSTSFTYNLAVTRIPWQKKYALDVSGSLTNKDDFDTQQRRYYKAFPFQFNSGQSYLIDLEGTGPNKLDTYLQIRDSKNKIIRSDDDGGTDRDARLFYRPTKTENLQIIATSFNSMKTGPYRLRVRTSTPKAQVDPNDRQTFKGTMTAARHRVEFQQGGLYRLVQKGKGWTPRTTVNPGSLSYGSNKFGGQWSISESYISVSKNGTHNLTVSPDYPPFNDRQAKTLTYKLEVSQVQFEPSDLLNATGSLSNTDPKWKSTKQPYKSYKVNLDTKRLYLIENETKTSFSIMPIVLDPKGKTSYSGATFYEKNRARLVFRPRQNGQHTLVVSFNPRFGGNPYRLRVRTIKQ